MTRSRANHSQGAGNGGIEGRLAEDQEQRLRSVGEIIDGNTKAIAWNAASNWARALVEAGALVVAVAALALYVTGGC